MNQSTHDVEHTSWLNIITECQQRPADVSAKQWLADNGVKEKAYYTERDWWPSTSGNDGMKFSKFLFDKNSMIYGKKSNMSIIVF